MNLVTPDFGLIFWTSIVFIILLLILKKFAWKPIIENVDARNTKIKNALISAEEAEKKMISLHAKNDEIIKINDKEFIVSSTIEKEKFEEFFSCQLNCPDVETLGGFMLKEIGHLPKVGEKIQAGSLEMIITSADQRKIKKITVRTVE